MSNTSIVARNDIFSLKWIHYSPRGDILAYYGILMFWFIILLYIIEGYMLWAETMHIGKIPLTNWFQCNMKIQ